MSAPSISFVCVDPPRVGLTCAAAIDHSSVGLSCKAAAVDIVEDGSSTFIKKNCRRAMHGLRAAPRSTVLLLSSLLACTRHPAVCSHGPMHSTPLFDVPSLLSLRGGAQNMLSFLCVCDSTKMGEYCGVVGECVELGKWKTVVRMDAAQVVRLLFVLCEILVCSCVFAL